MVTGGAGYIGSVIVRALLKANRPVIVLDDLSRGHADAVPTEATFVHGSILDPIALADAFSHGAEDVIHLAAFAYVGESVREPEKYFHNNVAGTQALCQAAAEHRVRRIVFSSSCTVYGNPESIPISEDTPLAPCNPYGETKKQCEEILRDAVASHSIRSAALRYFNAAGAVEDAGERHAPETHLIPLALAAARGEGPSLTVFGETHSTRDGTCERDYIHVADLATAHLDALSTLDHRESLVCNLGTGKGATVREVLAAIETVTGLSVPHTVGDPRPGDPPSLVAACDVARNLLGWSPKRSALEEIVEDANAFMDRQR